MIAGELSFDPTFVKAKPGARVTVTFEGPTFRHNFYIDALGLRHEIPAEKDTTASFTLPSSGPVIFYCAVPNHRRGGMQGAFYFS